MTNNDIVIAITQELKPQSKWERGVHQYALELLNGMEDQGINLFKIPLDKIEDTLLTGSLNWKDYSWTGGSLISLRDICVRLSTPSEREISQYGKIPPSNHEEWLDVQARALYQASLLIQASIKKLLPTMSDDVKIANKDLICYFSGKLIRRGEIYFPYTVYEDDTLEAVEEELAIHPEAKLIIDRLDMFGNGTDNDCFLPQDYEDLVDDYFNVLVSKGYISETESEVIVSNNGNLDKHEAVYEFLKGN